MVEKSKYTLLLTFILVSSILFNIINNIEKIGNYMDEEFHVDQTLAYYKNNFEYWNSKLTTFPGTFLLSSIFLKLSNSLQVHINDNNSLKILRMFSIIISSLTFYILGFFKKKTNVEKYILHRFQLLICFLPINFFYNFLYYTDTFSIFSLVVFFYLNLYATKNYFLRFLSGILCVLIRQNNIIWINLMTLNDTISSFQNCYNNMSVRILFKEIYSTIIRNIDILIIDILFIVFFASNNFSVVLGDKSNHNIVFHLAQVNHLLIFSLVFFPTFNFKVLRNLSRLLNSRKKAMRFTFLFFFVILLVLICNRFSYIHDFILSDNRHYMFYYFKKIYLKDNLRYALLIYVSLAYTIIINDNIKLLKDNRIISWFICSILCLAPSKLVEMRYFTPCYIILIILVNYNKESFDDLNQLMFNWWNIWAHLVMNGATLYIFLFRQFENKYMNNEISRFMY